MAANYKKSAKNSDSIRILMFHSKRLHSWMFNQRKVNSQYLADGPDCFDFTQMVNDEFIGLW